MVSFCKKGAIKKKSLLPLFSIKYTTFYWEIINLLYSEGLRNVLFINCLLYDCFSSQENKRAGKVWKDILDFIGNSPPATKVWKDIWISSANSPTSKEGIYHVYTSKNKYGHTLCSCANSSIILIESYQDYDSNLFCWR